MEYTHNDYLVLSSFIHDQILHYDLKSIVSHLEPIQSECLKQFEDMTEKIFHCFVFYGCINDVKNHLRLWDHGYIADTIIFKQSMDKNINIFAKLIYRKYGQNKQGFLDWQLEKLFAGQEIDILEEFAAYRISIGRKPYTPDILK